VAALTLLLTVVAKLRITKIFLHPVSVTIILFLAMLLETVLLKKTQTTFLNLGT
jgi:hypothetical protein